MEMSMGDPRKVATTAGAKTPVAGFPGDARFRIDWFRSSEFGAWGLGV